MTCTATGVPGPSAKSIGRYGGVGPSTTPPRTRSTTATREQSCGVDDDWRCCVSAESRWLRVLRRWIYSGQDSVPLVFGHVTERAEVAALDEALFWTGRPAQHPNVARTDQEDVR